METLKKLVKEMSSLPGNVGYEDEVIRYVCRHLKTYKENITIDSIGNVCVHIGSDSQKRMQKVMLFAHMDEVGMMVKHITKKGFLRIEKLGSINPNIVHGQRVDLIGEKGTVEGVIGVRPHHLLRQEDKYHTYPMEELYIDIGAENEKEVRNIGVMPGTPVVMKSHFIDMGMCISNKALDDRALTAVLLYLCDHLDRKRLDCDLYIVFSVQEEFNTRGLLPMMKTIRPDIAIGLDITPATDTPDTNNGNNVSLGKGPALTYMNHHSRGTLAGLVPNKRFLQYLEKMAEKQNVSVQHEVATGILTETAYIIFEKSNLVVANISVPTRYTHTPIETLHMKDLMGVYKILEAFLYDFQSDMHFGKQYDGLYS